MRQWAITFGKVGWTSADGHAWLPKLKTWCEVNCEDWIFQLECSKETHLVHFQMYVRFSSQITLRALQHRARTGLGVAFNHCSPACSKADRKCTYLKDYTMKEDTRIAGPWGKDQVPTYFRQRVAPVSYKY